VSGLGFSTLPADAQYWLADHYLHFIPTPITPEQPVPLMDDATYARFMEATQNEIIKFNSAQDFLEFWWLSREDSGNRNKKQRAVMQVEYEAERERVRAQRDRTAQYVGYAQALRARREEVRVAALASALAEQTAALEQSDGEVDRGE